MTQYYLLAPEVPGYVGNNCKPSPAAAEFTHFDLELDSMPHDCLMTTISKYIVRGDLAKAVREGSFSGAELADLEVSFSEDYEYNTRHLKDKPVPELVWLKVSGKPGEHDFGVLDEEKPVRGLVVSHSVYKIILGLGLEWCDVYDFSTGNVVACGKPTASLMNRDDGNC